MCHLAWVIACLTGVTSGLLLKASSPPSTPPSTTLQQQKHARSCSTHAFCPSSPRTKVRMFLRAHTALMHPTSCMKTHSLCAMEARAPPGRPWMTASRNSRDGQITTLFSRDHALCGPVHPAKTAHSMLSAPRAGSGPSRGSLLVFFLLFCVLLLLFAPARKTTQPATASPPDDRFSRHHTTIKMGVTKVCQF